MPQASLKKKRKGNTPHTRKCTQQLIADTLHSPGPPAGYSFYSPPPNLSQFIVKHKSYELLTFKLLYG